MKKQAVATIRALRAGGTLGRDSMRETGFAISPIVDAYGMSKGGVLQLTKSLAVEYIKTPMRVNAIAPAGCNNIPATVQFPEGMNIDLATRMAGLRGMPEPKEAAALFAFPCIRRGAIDHRCRLHHRQRPHRQL